MVSGSVEDLLLRLATELDDTTLSTTADGRVGRTRAIRALDTATRQEYLKLRGDCSDMMPFKQVVTLTADSSDADRYALPPRSREVIAMWDGSAPVTPLSAYNTTGSGFVLEEGGRAIRKRNYEPSATVSAWVIQEPAALSLGKASGASATTIVFPSTATIGTVNTQNDYYNGARVSTIADSEIRVITDFVGSTRAATVSTWSSTPTGTSAYCIMFDMPEAMIEPVVLRAAIIVSRVDKVMESSIGDIQQAYSAAHRDARVVLDKMNRSRIKGVRGWSAGDARMVT